MSEINLLLPCGIGRNINDVTMKLFVVQSLICKTKIRETQILSEQPARTEPNSGRDRKRAKQIQWARKTHATQITTQTKRNKSQLKLEFKQNQNNGNNRKNVMHSVTWWLVVTIGDDNGDNRPTKCCLIGEHYITAIVSDTVLHAKIIKIEANQEVEAIFHQCFSSELVSMNNEWLELP